MILAGVSLLVTTLVQMVSALFGLRGRWQENVVGNIVGGAIMVHGTALGAPWQPLNATGA